MCYLITFENTAQINPGTIKVEISNLLNPESVALTGDITITTLMKYTADTIYYKIDTLIGPSNYRAISGQID
jgi:hypothetical protein